MSGGGEFDPPPPSVRNWYDNHFTGRWLGHRPPTEWPPRRTDRSPFFLLLSVQARLCVTKQRALGKLEQQNRDTFAGDPVNL